MDKFRVSSTYVHLTFAISMFFSAGTFASEVPAYLSCNIAKDSVSSYSGFCSIPYEAYAPGVKKNRVTSYGAPRVVNVTLNKYSDLEFRGEMPGKHAEDRKEFALIPPFAKNDGLIKTPYGWFVLNSYQSEIDTLVFTANEQERALPTTEDIRIIEMASSLLSNETNWNRNDDRHCPSDAQKLSLFCALMKATDDVTGWVQYRQPALQSVRSVLNRVGGERLKKHRLMDYNNHPDTTLEDIQKLLLMSKNEIDKLILDRVK